MGTSSSFKGRGTKRTEQSVNNEVNWTKAKTSMSKYISSKGIVGKPESLIRNYIKASGGTNEIIKNSDKLIKAIYNFATIVDDFASVGVDATLKKIGVILKDNEFGECLSEVVYLICDSSVLKSDTAIIAAVANTLAIVESMASEEDTISKEEAEVLQETLFVECIWQMMLIEYGHSFEKYASDIEDTASLEERIKECIKAKVVISFDKLKKSKSSSEITYKKIMEETLRLLEGE